MHAETRADFDPPPWLRHRHLQSVLPSLPLRRPAVSRRARGLIDASREWLVDCGDGTRLLALVATQESAGRGPARGQVVLHHGWEGSAESLYLLSVGQALFEAGFDVVRLNLRDHGPTHHLNEELFHSNRLPEVIGAVAAIGRRAPHLPMSLIGFSLGGNFALRVGAQAARAGLSIARIVAISPVLDPAVTLEALERGPALYREYFLLKWRRSLRLKQAAWPGRYDFADLLGERSLTGMTARMVAEYTSYPDLGSYLRGYAIVGEALAPLEVPSRIITSSDDPMIPAADLSRLARVPSLSITLTRHGGHCGFVDRLGAPTWIDRELPAELAG
jgi:predicted alpha/beta-fold hydrolase